MSSGDFPRGPAVKTSPSKAGGVVQSLDGGQDSTRLEAKKPEYKTEAVLQQIQ